MTAAGQQMRFNIDSWDVGYGTAIDVEPLVPSNAEVLLDVEVPAESWGPIDPDPRITGPEAVLFVDGVRRIDARVWIDEPITADGVAPTSAVMGICASYAAGVVCCCAGQAHVIATEVRRGIFSPAEHAVDLRTPMGTYSAAFTATRAGTPLPVALSSALQQRLADVEVTTAVAARSALTGHVDSRDDLLVIDGPLRGRTPLPRTVGFIKSHQSEYLPPERNRLVGQLKPSQRTPVFGMGSSWDRYSWYLRLPCDPGAPWAGIVRLEAAADLPKPHAIELANLTQAILPRYASTEYKDARAPQNLYPIAGLERDLRHRLGDQQMLYRALRAAAA